MLRYNFLFALRHLVKNKTFTAINMAGLALGIVCCVLILQYVFFEQSYDRFYSHADRLYRITSSRYTGTEKQYDKAKAFIPLGKALKEELPEVEEYVTMFPIFSETDIFISHKPEKGERLQFREQDVFHVRGDVFKVFDFKPLKGTLPEGPPAPGTVYISASIADKYFRDEDPIGKVISHNLNEDYKVAGVFADTPANAHIHFNFIFPWEQLSPDDDGHWRWDGFLTYILLKPGTDAAAFADKLAAFNDKLNREEVAGKVFHHIFHLQPVADIHLHSNLMGEVEPNGNGEVVYILLALALFVLFIAWVNYINLSTAKLLDRGREVAIRKIIGSHKRHLVMQLLTEALLLNSFAALLALVAIVVVMPHYSAFTGMPLSMEMLGQFSFWLPFLLIVLCGTLTSGIVPALMFSSFEPIKALKGRWSSGTKGFAFYLRGGLVVFQLVISLLLITGSIVVYRQLNYMNKLDARVEKDNVVVVRTLQLPGPPGADSVFVGTVANFKNSLNSYPFIEGVTLSSGVPGQENQFKPSGYWRSPADESPLTFEVNRIDYDFLALYKPRLIAGRGFSSDFPSDREGYLINKEALRQLGYSSAEEALERGLYVGNDKERREILGVIDYQTMAARTQAAPEVFVMSYGPAHYLSIKLAQDRGQRLSLVLEKIQSAWSAQFPERPFEFFFLNDFFASQYRFEQKLQQSTLLFAALAIALACLGLYGLTTYTYLRRTKEMAVRKVLGSSARQIVQLLLKDFLKPLLAAGLVFPPVVYYLLSRWLENYHYRISIAWWYYAAAFGLMVLIAVACVCYHTLKIAQVNPARLLKDE